jgi:hypothetical protein
MKRQFVALAILALALAPAAFARNDAMSLIPNDSVSVGVVRLADMRSSPLSAALFAQTAHISNNDGDSEKFLRESGLQPMKDVAVIVFATSPRTNLGSEADFLIAADGRFNVDRLTSALVARGAVKKSSAHGAYFALPEKEGHQGVVAFPDAHLALIGSETAVIEALASRASGGTSFAAASGLGRDMARIDAHATAFVLVDVPRAQRITGAPKMGSHGAQSQMLGTALKNVSTVAIWATDSGDSLKLSALGLSTDAETLGLVEDTLRGALSAMRLAAQDNAPEMVSLLRKFTVTRTDNSVSISGSVPAETFKTWVAKSQSHASSR